MREQFTRRGWSVVRNLTEGFGVPWQQAFGTDDRSEVASYRARNGATAERFGRTGPADQHLQHPTTP